MEYRFLAEVVMEKIYFNYQFKFEFGEELNFKVELEASTLNLITKERNSIPDWCKMESFRCSNCRLSSDVKYCPVIVNLLDIVDSFSSRNSYDRCDIIIETEERGYHKKEVSLQTAVSSLIGIYMPTSGCPSLDMLRPMVKFHLPFATLEETVYRAVSMFLTAQYLRKNRGRESKFELDELGEIYSEIEKININFAKQLNKIEVSDASINAIVLLNSFANFANITFGEELPEILEGYFKMYL